MSEHEQDQETDAEWLRNFVEIVDRPPEQEHRDRVFSIADRLELLERAEAERALQVTDDRKLDEAIERELRETLAGLLDMDNDESIEPPGWIVLAIFHLANKTRDAGRSASFGASIGGLMQGLGAAAGSSGLLDRMVAGLSKKKEG